MQKIDNKILFAWAGESVFLGKFNGIEVAGLDAGTAEGACCKIKHVAGQHFFLGAFFFFAAQRDAAGGTGALAHHADDAIRIPFFVSDKLNMAAIAVRHFQGLIGVLYRNRRAEKLFERYGKAEDETP